MGVTNPSGAAQKTLEVARQLGLKGLKVAAVEGDDVGHLVGPDTMLWEGMSVRGVGRALIGANAYLGADAILPALEAGADVVITGRVADPALFLAPAPPPLRLAPGRLASARRRNSRGPST